MKKYLFIALALISLNSFAFAGGDQNQNQYDGSLGQGPTYQERNDNLTLDALKVTQLDENQKLIIYSIYEEEKVARDVYITLGNLYPEETTFANIQLAEQTHMDAVRRLCVKYGIEIPDVDQAVGVFNLLAMSDLYEGFIDAGDDSLSSALQVGIDIETMDIADLGEVLEYQNMPRDVQRVLTNLISGSISHLDAFTTALERENIQ
ncbi:exported hypothetical protein [uncultured Desulfobacterium sp.]|uniref:DUF2202 domain-containing protein n=1 Tax=uncultured Desulfobacterium sp. TaxID=201089 RepID=A0A445MW35_9BACT|nr:exported hypothetical protein [uncultured Desulfobacterium sp.]